MADIHSGKVAPVVRRSLKPIVSTAILEDRHLLLVQEGSGADRGKWNLPGGKATLSEGLVAAAEREAGEETGFQVRIHALRSLYTYIHRDGKPRLRILFMGRVIGGEPKADGHEIIDVRWFSLNQIRAMPDERLCKPQVLRRMFSDLHCPAEYPLDLLREFAPTVAA